MKRTTGVLGVVIVVAMLVGAFAVPAVVAAPQASEVRFANYAATTSNQWFMKFLGVNGEANAAGYEKWTQAYGVSWDLDASSGSVGQVTPVAVTFDFDLGALPILQRCDDDEVTAQVLINMTFLAEGQLLPYTEYRMTNVVCRYYSIASTATEDRPLVTVLLEFQHMIVTYMAYDATGQRIGLRQHELSWIDAP